MNNRHQPQTNVSSCPESFAKWYCLNGATCFSLLIDESIFYNCWCHNGFHGPRCDYKHATTRVRDDQPDDDAVSLGVLYEQRHQRPSASVASSINSSSSPSSSREDVKPIDDPGAGFIAVPEATRGSLIGLPNGGIANRRHLNQTLLNSESKALIVFFYLSCLVLIVMIILLVIRLFKKRTSGAADYNLPAASYLPSQRTDHVMIYRTTDKEVGGRRGKSDRWQQTDSSPAGGADHVQTQDCSDNATMRLSRNNISQPDNTKLIESSLMNRSIASQQQQAVVVAAAAAIGCPHQRANDPQSCKQRRYATIQLEGPEAIQEQITSSNSQGSRGLSDESVGLREAKQEQERRPGYRYLFVQMAIIKRASDMRRAANLDNNQIAQSGRDFQTFEV